MNNVRYRVFTATSIVLWSVFAIVLLCTILMDGRWQVEAFSAVTITLICFYSYKGNPTPKNRKGLFIACGISYVMLIAFYFLKCVVSW